MKDLMEKIAAGLNLTLADNVDFCQMYRMDAEDYRLLFRIGGYMNEDRIRISVVWGFGTEKHVLPQNYLPLKDIEGLKTEIKVSANKDADAIIKDIKRRLMPNIESITPMLKKAVEDSLAKIANRQRDLQTLMDAAKELGVRKSDRTSDEFRMYKMNGPYGNVRIMNDMACNTELNNIPIPTMIKVLKLLAEESSRLPVEQEAA